ncbi:MAG: sugar-binding protein, partial [Phycisphaerae bacterium]|nr:sugar-binding protein [Phycisphaerae bacterium]
MNKTKQMKKAFSIAVWLISAVVLAAAAGSVYGAEKPKVLQAYRTKSPPVIDGRLSEPAWAQAEKAVGFSNYNQPKVMAADQTIGRILFDDQNLYVGIECLESRMDLLKKDLKEMGKKFDYRMGEVVEVFVDGDALGKMDYNHFLVGANGALLGSFYDAMQIAPMPYRAAVSIAKDRFFAEFAIPLSMLHLGPQTKTTWGFNLNRARSVGRKTSGGPNDNLFSSWNNTHGAFNKPYMFGRLKIDLDTSGYWYDVRLIESPPDTLDKADVKIINRTGRAARLKVTLGFDSAPGKKKTYEKIVSLANGEAKIVTFAGPFPAWAAGAAVSVTLTDPATKKTVYYGATRSADVTPRGKGPVPEYSSKDVDNGYVLFAKDYNSIILRTYMPSLDQVNKPLEIRASPGEYEPCVLGVRTFKKLTGLKVDIAGDLVSSGGETISGDNVDLRIITETKYWMYMGEGQEFRWQPMLAESKLPAELAAGRTYIYWVTLKVPADAAPGEYAGRLQFRAAGAPAKNVPLHVTVWPIKLLTPPQMCWGYYYDVARMPDDRRTLEYQKKIFKNVAEHGTNNITIYGGIGPGGTLDKCDPRHLPFARTMNDALAAGAITRGIPVMTLGSTITTKAVAEARLKNNWPELLMYAYDEPGDDERIAVAKKGLTQIKKAHPEVKTVTAISEKGIKALGDLYDVWVVGGGLGSPVIAEGRDKGKLIWTYDCGNRVCDLPFSRYFAGIFSWKTQVKGNWLWGLVDLQFQHRMKRPLVEALKNNFQAVWRLYREN